MHPGDLAQVETVVWMSGIEAFEFYSPGGLAHELLGHDLAFRGAHDDAVAAADGGGGGDDDLIAVAIHRLHRIAADFQRVGVRVGDLGEAYLVPAAADRVPAVVEKSRTAG